LSKTLFLRRAAGAGTPEAQSVVDCDGRPRGIDLNALEQALNEYPVKACWIMTNSQNPLGFTLSAEKKRSLSRC
jgi:DNA-binding transcriptional MocR family regulator